MNKVEAFVETVGVLSLSIGKMLLAIIKTPYLFVPTFILVGFDNYLNDYARFVEALAICILADSVFGVWLSLKENRFQLSKSMAIVQKLVVYFFYLIIIHYISRLDWLTSFDTTIIYITKFVLTAMILTEGKSAIENGNILFPNKIAGTIVWFFEKIEGKLDAKVERDSRRDHDNINQS
jgi:hypothetical protein